MFVLYCHCMPCISHAQFVIIKTGLPFPSYCRLHKLMFKGVFDRNTSKQKFYT